MPHLGFVLSSKILVNILELFLRFSRERDLGTLSLNCVKVSQPGLVSLLLFFSQGAFLPFSSSTSLSQEEDKRPSRRRLCVKDSFHWEEIVSVFRCHFSHLPLLQVLFLFFLVFCLTNFPFIAYANEFWVFMILLFSPSALLPAGN